MAEPARKEKPVPETRPEQWGLKGPLRPDRYVEGFGDKNRDTWFMRSPVTGDIRGVSQKEAQRLSLESGWEPVVEPSAVRLLQRQVLGERSKALAAAATGGLRGVTGGLGEFLLPHGDEAGARALEAQGEELPSTTLLGEAAGLAAPALLSGGLGGARLLTVPGLAEAAGAGVSRTAGEGILGRALGVGLEGGLVGSTYAAGQTAIDDSPLTSQKLMAGFLAGALPGAVIGGGIGGVESLGKRFALRGGLAREDVLRAGLTDADLMRIAQREHGVAVPGLTDELSSNIIRDPAVSSDFMGMARDRGPVGQQVRRELLNAPAQREAALQKAAAGLDKIQEVDDLALEGWTGGEHKRSLVEKWMEGVRDSPDIGATLADAAKPRTGEEILARLSKRETAAPEHARFAAANRALSEAEDQLDSLKKLQASERDPARWEAVSRETSAAEGRVADLKDELDQAEGAWRDKFQASDRPQAVENVIDLLKRAAKKDPDLEDKLISQVGARRGRGPVYGWEPVVRRGLLSGDQGIIETVAGVVNTSPKAQIGMEGAAGERLWRSQPMQLLDDLGREADGLLMQSRGVLGEPRTRAAQVRDLILDARKRIAKGDRVEAFIAMDNLKKRLSPYALPDQWLSANDNVARMVRGAYEDSRAMLENPALWGEKAASAQRDMNSLFHARLARKGAYFDNFFEDAGVPHPRNPWVNAKRASPDKVRSALKGIINPDDSAELSSYKGHVAETRDLISKMKEHYDLPAANVSKLDAALGSVDDAEKGFDEAVHFARREAQANALFNARGNVVPGYAKWVAMHFLGPVGFGLGLAAERVANPGQAIFQRAVLERVLRGSESRVTKAVTKLLTGKDTRFVGLGVTELGARASFSLLKEKKEEKRTESYAETLAEVTKLSTPEAATAQAAQAMPFVVGTLPNAPAYMGGTLSRAAQYVMMKAPVQPKWTPMGVVVDTPSDSELDRFERVYAAAFDPISAVEDAANGDGSVDAMRAAEFVAPELINDVRQMLLEELGSGAFRGGYHSKVDLSLVLGIALDRSMEPEHIVAQQMVHAARFKAMPDNRRTYGEDGVNKDYRDTHASKADRIESDEVPQ